MDWAQRVTIESEAIKMVALLRMRIQALLWTLSQLLYLATAITVVDACALLIWRQRARNKVRT